jgi:16S rRNA (guanine1516-N2)-methyltransferase
VLKESAKLNDECGMMNDEAGDPALIAVLASGDDPALRVRAAEIAARCGLPLVDQADLAFEMLLTVTPERVELRFPQRGGPRPVYVDFVEGPIGYERRMARSGLLFQAVGFRTGRPTVIDATAGLGRDAFRLAYHGCRVTALERSPILFVLLEDGLARAEQDPVVGPKLQDRLRFIHADARTYLRGLAPEEYPDVVYLDPMYPPRQKSALVKVEMRILRRLLGDDPDAAELFDAARAIARQRVVVKRHRYAEPLAGEPTHSHADRSTRYDVYARPTLRPEK